MAANSGYRRRPPDILAIYLEFYFVVHNWFFSG